MARGRRPAHRGDYLQELTTRFPGRTDIRAIAELLHETAEHHDPCEKSSSPHDWWHWYAAYFDARQAGSTPEEASVLAARYMEDAGLVVPRMTSSASRRSRSW